MKKLLLAFSLLTALSCFAQSSPGLVYGQIPTAGQWNSYFAGKFDYNVNGLAVSFGGTGSTTATGALRNLIGAAPTTGYFVRGNGATWAAGAIQAADVPTLNQNTTGTAAAIAGGATGSMPYQSGSGSTAFLSGNTTTTPQFLTSTGTGSAAQAPTLTGSTGSGNVVLAASPSITSAVLTTPSIGVATATSVNKVAITAPATGSTLTIADGKTLIANNSITLAGSDSTTMTFPSTSATIARTDGSQTFTNTQTFSGTLSVSGTFSGAGVSTYLASPPAIGATTPAAGSFTTLSATSTVSGAGFVAMQASPNPIGSTAPNSGAFTTLAASSTVSGAGFSTYLASPPAIGGTAPAAVTATTLTATSGINIGTSGGKLIFSATAPTLGSCGTGSPTITGTTTASFRVNIASGNPSACSITLPAAATGWNCFAQNVTTVANAWIIRQTATSTTGVTLTNYSATTITAWNNSDVLAVTCSGY